MTLRSDDVPRQNSGKAIFLSPLPLDDNCRVSGQRATASPLSIRSVLVRPQAVTNAIAPMPPKQG
jgi:hypothetical protein